MLGCFNVSVVFSNFHWFFKVNRRSLTGNFPTKLGFSYSLIREKNTSYLLIFFFSKLILLTIIIYYYYYWLCWVFSAVCKFIIAVASSPVV